ncbi:unnamed protein product [Prorocentrum cordatum]|uniref:Carrier domain-containing protein n=1 Tax=Prorocentrum cordatum TaxID=2364126 RepID=A0ABN9VAJ1_9DINO|nr:unnamed protein product [Polarella glacialis]
MASRDFLWSSSAPCPLEEARRRAEAELTAFKAARDRRGEACMLLSVAEVACDEGGPDRLQEALAVASEARALLREAGDDRGLALASLAVAACQVERCAATEAREAATEALQLFRRLGDKRRECRALHALSVAMSVGPLTAVTMEAGLQAARDAHQVAQELGARKIQAHELYFVAAWHLMMDKPQDALPPAKQAAELFGELRYGRGWQPLAQGAVVGALAGMGEQQKAVNVASNAVSSSQAQGDRRSQVIGLHALAAAHLAAPGPTGAAEALRVCGEGMELCQQLGELKWEAGMHHAAAQASLGLGRQGDAEAAAHDAAAMLQALGEQAERAVVLHTLVGALVEGGQPARALGVASQIRGAYRELGQRRAEAGALLLEAALQLHAGGADAAQEALELATEAQGAFMGEEDLAGEAATWGLIVWLRHTQGQQEEVLRALRTQRALLRRAGDAAAEAKALCSAAQLLAEGGDLDQAAGLSGEAARMARHAGAARTEAESLVLLAQCRLASLCQAADAAPPDQAGRVLCEGEGRALRPAREAAVLARSLPDSALLAAALSACAQVHVVMRRGTSAIGLARRACSLFRELGDAPRAAESLLLSAEGGFQCGSWQRAEEEAAEACSIFEEAGDQHGQDRVAQVLERRDAMATVATAGAVERGGAPLGVRHGGGAEALTAAGELAEAEAKPASPKEEPGLGLAVALKMTQTAALEAIGDTELAEDLDLDSPLMDLGLDSLASISFREDLVQASGLKLPSSLAFDYPSVLAVAAHMVELSRA